MAALIEAGPAPLVEPDSCTFFYRGVAESVRLQHFGVGLPPDLRLHPGRGHRALVPGARPRPRHPPGVQAGGDGGRGHGRSASSRTRSTRSPPATPSGPTPSAWRPATRSRHGRRSIPPRPRACSRATPSGARPSAGPPARRCTCRRASTRPAVSATRCSSSTTAATTSTTPICKVILDNLIHRGRHRRARRRLQPPRRTAGRVRRRSPPRPLPDRGAGARPGGGAARWSAEPHGRAPDGGQLRCRRVAVRRRTATRGRTAACSCSPGSFARSDGHCATREGVAVGAGHRAFVDRFTRRRRWRSASGCT